MANVMKKVEAQFRCNPVNTSNSPELAIDFRNGLRFHATPKQIIENPNTFQHECGMISSTLRALVGTMKNLVLDVMHEPVVILIMELRSSNASVAVYSKHTVQTHTTVNASAGLHNN